MSFNYRINNLWGQQYNRLKTLQSLWGQGEVRFDLSSLDATGDLYYRSDNGDLATLPIGNTNEVLTMVSGLPKWQPAQIPVDTGIRISFQTIY